MRENIFPFAFPFAYYQFQPKLHVLKTSSANIRVIYDKWETWKKYIILKSCLIIKAALFSCIVNIVLLSRCADFTQTLMLCCMHYITLCFVCCLRCAVSSVAVLVSAKALYQLAQKAFLLFSMGASAVRCVPGSRVRPAVSCYRVTVSAACSVTTVPASLESQESVSVSFNHQLQSITTEKHCYNHKLRP